MFWLFENCEKKSKTYKIRKYDLSPHINCDVIILYEKDNNKANLVGVDRDLIVFVDGQSEIDVEEVYSNGQCKRINVIKVRLNRNT
jgi:hypothetical protein